MAGSGWKQIVGPKVSVLEEPFIQATENRLSFIDIFEPAFYRIDLTTMEERRWMLPSTVGSFALTTDPGTVLLALIDGIYYLDLEDGSLDKQADAPYDQGHYRFNDGKCDRRGRFWVGAMRHRHSDRPHGQAGLYRFDDRGLSEQASTISISNGMGWSLDNRLMYMADRPFHRILAFDFDDEQGTVSNPHTFIEIDGDTIPDGAAIDAEGHYWVAMYRGACLRRYRPDGTLDRVVETPPNPTMVAFHPERDEAWLTTSSLNVVAGTEGGTAAGGIYVASLGVTGIPEPLFRLNQDR